MAFSVRLRMRVEGSVEVRALGTIGKPMQSAGWTPADRTSNTRREVCPRIAQPVNEEIAAMDNPSAAACPAARSETESVPAEVPPGFHPGAGRAALEPFPSLDPSVYLQLPLDVARELAGGVQPSAEGPTENAGGET